MMDDGWKMRHWKSLRSVCWCAAVHFQSYAEAVGMAWLHDHGALRVSQCLAASQSRFNTPLAIAITLHLHKLMPLQLTLVRLAGIMGKLASSSELQAPSLPQADQVHVCRHCRPRQRECSGADTPR